MKTLILVMAVAFAFALSACGGSSSSNDSNAKNSNGSPSPSPSSSLAAEKDQGKDLPPTSMDVAEFLGSYNKENEGRIVTVTGGLLDQISYNSLLIRNGASYAFYCNGDFSSYMEMKTRIDDLRYKGKSPTATVKGIYGVDSNGSPSLSGCVLTDIKK